MISREYCEAWPKEIKDAEARRYAAACKIRMLEGLLDRIGPEEFDDVMLQLEEAHKAVQEAGAEVMRLKTVLSCAGFTFT